MSSQKTKKPSSIWHTGETILQQSVNMAERMAAVGRYNIRDHLVEEHRHFYPLLRYVILGTVDAHGGVWATLRGGAPGFLRAPDSSCLHLDIARDVSDPANAGINEGDAIALLGIDLKTRRRNRVNGSVRHLSSKGFDIVVGQSFGNCPQYIQLRDCTGANDAPGEKPPRDVLDRLDASARQMIAAADTFFVASYVDRDDGGRQIDVSHRGGKPGFVRLDPNGSLTIPDFAGNAYFNTLGNILINPRAGLTFVEFESGDLLQMSGTAELILDSAEISAFQGAERLWRFHPRSIVRRKAALQLRWRFANGWSPNTLLTGSWREAAERLKASELRGKWRPFRVTTIVQESTTIRSFCLAPLDGAGLVAHVAGQHLPICIPLQRPGEANVGTYTLSVAPSDEIYRISVKRDGLISRHLHDAVQVGDQIEVREPAGEFTIALAEQRPVVMLAAGIGITPMLAMLRHIVYEGWRTRKMRTVILFAAARNKHERAFDTELNTLVEKGGGAIHLVRVLSQTQDATIGVDYDLAGHIDIAMLGAAPNLDDFDFYLCGPHAFMQTLYDGLRDQNVRDSRIHAEEFGSVSLHRRIDRPTKTAIGAGPRAATSPVQVIFENSAIQATWTPADGTLLEFAEQQGLAPEFGCRRGSCGACRTSIDEGLVAYERTPKAKLEASEVLICCAVPAEREDGAENCIRLHL